MAHSFGSDNCSGIHPAVLEAIAEANAGHAESYGHDPLTAEARKAVCAMLGCDAGVYFVLTGTGANVLALRSVTHPYNSVICADTAHIYVHECGAPEAHTGCKLIPVATPDGKLTPEMVRPHLFNFGSEHNSQPKVISVTQPTEMGTLYTNGEITALAELAHSHGMYLHLDGTRLANAVAATGSSPHDMLVRSGVDVMTFGGTKNGMMLGESVIFLNPELGRNAKYGRKQLMQLPSKMRFVAAQFKAYLEDGLWLELAAHANGMARYLAEGLEGIGCVKIFQKPETNGIFAEVREDIIPALKAEGYYTCIDEAAPQYVRWMCSFDTTKDDADRLINFLRTL